MMDDKQTGPSPAEIADFLVGVVDAVFAMGVGLSNAGLVQREDLARIYERTLAQMDVLAARGDLGEYPHARKRAVATLAQAFAMPVRSGLQVIDGGKEG